LIIIVMGVTGSGKTTAGSLLAQQLQWRFADADDFHTQSNVEKMRNGVPLNDDDRGPWLERLRAEIAKEDAEGRNLVVACSALKKEYRDMLTIGPAVKFVYLKGSAELIALRLEARNGHFDDEKILAGQFADLEEPDNAVVFDIAGTPEEIVTEIRKRLRV
jgi:gluconokinase